MTPIQIILALLLAGNCYLIYESYNRKPKKYRYFVSFIHDEIHWSNGECSINQKIKTMGELNALQASLKNQTNYNDIIIVNYKLLK